MNINIDYSIRTPIYEQMVLEVERLVSLGILKSGEQIPSIRDFACNLSVNPNTVKKAYDILEQKGIIVSKSTKGSFIADNIDTAKEIIISERIEKIKDIMKELEGYGITKKEILDKIK